MNRALKWGTLVLVAAWAAPSFAAAADDDTWKPYRFLVGEWAGEGGGEGGRGSGSFSFAFDLKDHVLVRRNHAEVQGGSHEDLMVMYPEPSTKRMKAIYFDNEDRVINYTVEPSKDGKSLVFLSEELEGAPRFRLTYTKDGDKDDTVKIEFAIAPPGKPDDFKTYLEGTSHKKGQGDAKEKTKDKK